MSWDISLEIDTGRKMTSVVECGNMTFNVSGMYRAAGVMLSEMDEMPAEKAIPILAAALRYFDDPANAESLKALEPDNGWGSVDGARKYLVNLLAQCIEHPLTTVHVY